MNYQDLARWLWRNKWGLILFASIIAFLASMAFVIAYMPTEDLPVLQG